MPLATPADCCRLSVELLTTLRARGLMLATAESCTGGLIAAYLTDVAGSSDVFERGFVTYSNAAKTEALGVGAELIDRLGAVSPQVAAAMAEGALRHSGASVSLSVTGIAGPGGGSAEKPVGLVYIGCCVVGAPAHVEQYLFGAVGRSAIRIASVAAALDLALRVLQPR